MTLARRLFAATVGGGAFTPPAHTVAGPYATTDPHAVTVQTQVHCHTSASDGSYAPASLVASYLAAGYGALAITDHDMATAQPAGITTSIDGNEHSPSTQHIIAIDSTWTRGAETGAQAILDGIAADGGKAHIAHPTWSTGMTYVEMAALTGYMGLEIHNGHCITGLGVDPITYPAFSVDRWDALLTGVRRDVWGFAVDDLHTVGTYEAYDMGRLKVFAASNSAANIVAAIASGNFVADVGNYGMTPGFPYRTPAGIALSCAGATRIEAWGAGGLLTATNGSSHSHTFEGTEEYVRLVAMGDYTEPFSAALSDRWYAAEGTWAVAGGVLGLTSDATPRRMILRRHRQGDFTAQVDVKLGVGALSGVALMFNVLSGTHWYMVRLGESGVAGWNNVLAVGYTTDASFGAPLDSYAITATEGTWYTIAMDYTAATGRIRAKVWDRDAGSDPGTWQIDATDTTWKHGAFGLRANFAAEHDNLYISGFQTFYQPVAVG